MLETTVARLIQEVCKKNDREKNLFSDQIFKYLLSYPKLTASEKLAWFVIGKAVQRSPDLTACVSYQQIGQAINVTKDTAYRLVRGLKAKQFLLASLNNTKNQVVYTMNLPEDGIAFFKKIVADQLEKEKNLEIRSDSDALLSHASKDKEEV